MSKKRLVLSLGHKDLGTNLPEQKAAVAETAPIIADFVEEGWQVAVTHSNAPQVGMIHGALSAFAARHEGYTPSPLSVCHEPGLHRLRPAERTPLGAPFPRHL